MNKGKLDSTVFVTVTFSMPFCQRKGNVYEIETSADKRRLNLTKKILRCPEYDGCRKIAAEVRRKIRDEYGFPTVILREGVYRVPLSLKDEIREYIEGQAAVFYELRDKIIGKYEDLVEEDRKLLGEQFNPRDYPPPEVMASKFRVHYKFFQIMDVNGEFGEEEVKEELENIRLLLRESALELLRSVAKVFDLSGRKHPLRKALWSRVKFFLRVFGAKNISEDEDLESIVGRLREKLGNASYDVAKTEEFRAALKPVVDSLVRKVEGLVSELSDTRAIVLD